MTSVKADTAQRWEFAVFCHWCPLITTRGPSPFQVVPGAMAPEWSFWEVFRQLRKCEYKYIKPGGQRAEGVYSNSEPSCSNYADWASLGAASPQLWPVMMITWEHWGKAQDVKTFWDLTSLSSLWVIWYTLGVSLVTDLFAHQCSQVFIELYSNP